MTAISAAGICITAAIFCKVFDRFGKEYSAMLSAAVSAAVMGFAVLSFSPVAAAAESLMEKAGADSEYIGIMFRSAGICCITQLAGNICRDCGESNLASQAELCGRAMLAVNALPLFTEVIRIADRLLSA